MKEVKWSGGEKVFVVLKLAIFDFYLIFMLKKKIIGYSFTKSMPH